MKIAVASQNRREVTGHTGRCRKFWIYQIDHKAVRGRTLLELPREQSFHDSSPHQVHPLDKVDVLISGGMGQGLIRRLAARGVLSLVTSEADPDTAVISFLAGNLPPGSTESHDHAPGHMCGCH